jgi:serine protease Do
MESNKQMKVRSLLMMFGALVFLVIPCRAGWAAADWYQSDARISRDMEIQAAGIVERGGFLKPEAASAALATAIGKTALIPALPTGSGTLPAEALHDQMKQSTLIVGNVHKCGRCDSLHVNCSSGVAIGKDGICVSNYHVIELYASNSGSQENLALTVYTADGRMYPVVEILAASQVNDLAVFRVDTGGNTLTPMPLSPGTEVGGKVYALSHPSGMFYHFSEGMVTRNITEETSDGTSEQFFRMKISADYAVGSSGGPVADAAGNLTGVISTTRTVHTPDSEGRNVQMVVRGTIPVIALKRLLEEATE